MLRTKLSVACCNFQVLKGEEEKRDFRNEKLHRLPIEIVMKRSHMFNIWYSLFLPISIQYNLRSQITNLAKNEDHLIALELMLL